MFRSRKCQTNQFLISSLVFMHTDRGYFLQYHDLFYDAIERISALTTELLDYVQLITFHDAAAVFQEDFQFPHRCMHLLNH